MGKNLIIAEQSEVIRKGLVQIIRSFDLFDRIHEVSSAANLKAGINRFNPNVILINPLLIEPGLTQWLAGFKTEKIKSAAIVYEVFDEKITGLFDEIIQIEDSRLNIKNKLGKLISRPTGRNINMKVNDNALSPREKDVVRLLAKGLSNREISELLFISPHTTITHRKNITRKLNIKSVAGLIVYAIINEIVNVEELSN